MASSPRPQMPLLYNALVPLNSREHRTWRSRASDRAPWLAKQNIIPLTVDEFAQAQRHFPIIFSTGDKPVPLALMGITEGVNTFIDADGKLSEPAYLPAYVRRYPFILARLSSEHTELALCFDPTTDLVGNFPDGTPLFDNDNLSSACQATLNFCEQFEVAGQKTANFMAELARHDLLIDGEIAIQLEGREQPFVYRGFRMVDEDRLRELPLETVGEWHRTGVLALVYAHLLSLQLMRDIFARQIEQGKGPALSE